MREQLLEKLESALGELLVEAGDRDAAPTPVLDIPRQKEHGDFATNIAMTLAKRLRKKPREIAEGLVDRLGDAGGLLKSCEIAGPGFINFRLAENNWQNLLCDIAQAGDAYGSSDLGKGQKVQVEFVSANPTGPLSTGHGRQAILGDAICRLLAFTGHDVTREYYFNNGGRQMRVLGESVKARYLEQLGLASAPSEAALGDVENDVVDLADHLEGMVGSPSQRRELQAVLAERRNRLAELRAPFDQLTPREEVVLAGLVRGLSAPCIADEAMVSAATVRTQIRSILLKLGVHSQLAAVSLARRARWHDEVSVEDVVATPQ